MQKHHGLHHEHSQNVHGVVDVTSATPVSTAVLTNVIVDL